MDYQKIHKSKEISKVDTHVEIRGILLRREYSTRLIGWFVGFHGISTFVGYLMPNLFLCK